MMSSCVQHEISQIVLIYRYVDELQIYKAHRIMKFLGECPTIKLAKIIADTKWIHHAYPRRFVNVKPKNQKVVNHENLTSCKILIDYHVTNSKKKYYPYLLVDH